MTQVTTAEMTVNKIHQSNTPLNPSFSASSPYFILYLSGNC